VLSRATFPIHHQIRFFTSSSLRPVSHTHNTLIDGVDPHMMSMFDIYVPDSAPTHYDDLGDHQVKAISTASVGILDSNGNWDTLFHEKPTNGLLYDDLLIHPTTSDPTEPVVAPAELPLSPPSST
jgi:hypothetical protein